jgi:hypothetical protein
MEQGDKVTVILLVVLVAFAVLIVDERWLRAAIAFVPTMLLAQRAVQARLATRTPAPSVGAANRREDQDIRAHIDDLLKHFREFYTTCHLMAAGQLEPEEAKDLAGGIERRLNKLLAEVTDAARADPA